MTKIHERDSSSPAPGALSDREPEGRSTGEGSGVPLSMVVGAGFAVWGFVIGAGSLSDNSFFTHLATGRMILDSGIPTTDPYSFTATGESWVVQSWLASVLYGWMEQLGGAGAVRALMGLTAAAVAAGAWSLTRPAGNLIVRVAATALVCVVGATMWSSRPVLLGLALLVVTLLAAERRVPPWILVPVFWLWVNTHGSFPLGLVALAALALGRRLDGERPSVELRALAWAVGGTVLGAVNPLGPILLWFPVHMVGRQDLLGEIVEWQSPDFGSWWARVFLVLVGLAVVGLVRRPSWRAAIPFVVFLVASLLAARNVVVASLVLLPGLAHGLSGLGALDGRERTRAGAVLLGAMAVLGVVVGTSTLREPDWDLRDYPVDAVAWLDEQGRLGSGSGQRTATNDVTGNYLELLYGADAEVFLDDRLDLYPETVVLDFLALRSGAPGWAGILDRHGITQLVWPRTSALIELASTSSGWRQIYGDAAWVVLERSP